MRSILSAVGRVIVEIDDGGMSLGNAIRDSSKAAAPSLRTRRLEYSHTRTRRPWNIGRNSLEAHADLRISNHGVPISGMQFGGSAAATGRRYSSN